MGCGPLQFVCDAVGGAVQSVASTGFDAIAQSFGEAARTMTSAMWSAISATTTVDLSGSWFHTDLGITAALATVMVAALFLLQVIKGALRRDAGALGRAVTGSAIAFIGAAAAIAITDTLLVLVDQLSNGIIRAAGEHDIASVGQKLTPIALLGGNTPALVIVLSVFFVIASVLVWAVFIVRKALIIIAAIFAPIAFGGSSADATRGWVRKWIEFMLAMVFSKLLIVVIFVVALSLVGQSGGGAAGISNLMTGLLLLTLAAFAPFVVLKLVHFIGGDVAAAHHSAVMADATTAAGSAAGVFKGSARKVFGATSSAGAGSSSAGAAPASTGPGASGAAGAGPAAPVAVIAAGRRNAGSPPTPIRGVAASATTATPPTPPPDEPHSAPATPSRRVMLPSPQRADRSQAT